MPTEKHPERSGSKNNGGWCKRLLISWFADGYCVDVDAHDVAGDPSPCRLTISQLVAGYEESRLKETPII
jgi:hypothetical protein